MPAAVPPHKRSRELAAGDARATMLELAVSGDPRFRVSRLELDRGGVNYTVDTLDTLARQRPGDELFFLMGADSLRDLPTWKEPARLCSLATVVVVERSDSAGVSEASSPSEKGVGSHFSEKDSRPLFESLSTVLSREQIAAIDRHRVRMPRIDLSSSEIRQRVAAGHSIRYRTPRAVEEFIRANGIYR
jgi:nicotinate-nucleotide adenylyltransferase